MAMILQHSFTHSHPNTATRTVRVGGKDIPEYKNHLNISKDEIVNIQIHFGNVQLHTFHLTTYNPNTQ